ncbi:MAG: amidase family protein [Burkholderiaceae bacterium]
MDDWQEHFTLYLKILGAMLCSQSPKAVREARLALLVRTGDPISLAMAEGVRAGLPELSGWLAEREQVRGRWREFFAAHDLLLAPACQGNAFAHHSFDSSALFAGCTETLTIAGQTVPYLMNAFFASVSTLSGLPATAFPADQTVRGLPVGLQVIGPYLNDLTPIGFLGMLEESGLIGFRAPPDLPAGALDTPQERRPG